MSELSLRQFLKLNRLDTADGIHELIPAAWGGSLRRLMTTFKNKRDRLQPYQRLNLQDQLISPNSKVNLLMQGDGNLALYRTHFGRLIWSSRTTLPTNHAIMKGDGNLVAAPTQGAASWETGTGGHPGAELIIQDDGNLVIRDVPGNPIWASGTVQDFSSPTYKYTDERGYTYVETSEWWKDLCQDLPCFDALQWPDYKSTHIDCVIDNQPVVIQLWKGWCPKFLGLTDFPGGVGAEVGVYRRIPGHIRPTSLPFLPSALEKIILGAMATLTDNDLWWPFPELHAHIKYTLVNPETNQKFFEAGPEDSYWLAKWMNDGSYSQYQRDAGKRWNDLPAEVPGNSRTPLFSQDYWLDYEINGQKFARWA